jgi:hypothetical protein
MAGALSKRKDSSVFDPSEHHEEIVHPNEERSASVDDEIDPDEPFHWPKSSFVRWFLKYDERVLRPFFIRKYNKRVALLEDEY